MRYINIRRRVSEQTDSIRKRIRKSKTMTPGEARAIMNRLAALDIIAAKMEGQVERGRRSAWGKKEVTE